MLDAPPPHPIAEVYYASSCTPCRLELPALAKLAEEGGTPFTIIILSEETQARRELAEASPKLAALAQEAAVPPTDPKGQRALLRDAGDADGVLPYARSVAPDGRLCASWRGIVSGERIRALLAACK